MNVDWGALEARASGRRPGCVAVRMVAEGRRQPSWQRAEVAADAACEAAAGRAQACSGGQSEARRHLAVADERRYVASVC